MEQHAPNLSDKLISPQTLALIRSLIINPHTSDSTISSILETLTRSLQLSSDPLILNHILKLLTDLSSRHPDLSPLIFESIRSNTLSPKSTRLAAESLAALASISDQSPSLVPALDDIDGQLFVSLCFEEPVKVRLWLLRNAERFRMRPYLLFTVFLGFTKDPYPYVREAALDGLVNLRKTGDFENIDAIEGCYCRAVELLCDMEDCVRSAAVRVVSEWGKMLVAAHQDRNKKDWSDAVFIQLCSMVRDMSMEVRVEVFDALGKIGIVSEDVLLQTLSKKVLGIMREKKSHGQSSAGSLEISAAGAAGAFVHGLEDEFYEVRKSVCNSLRALTGLSAKFASEALKLLMDMLNDDSMVVRLQALETMHHMATCGHLKVQEMHMHTFLGTLVDSSRKIRSAARKILKLVKLPNLKLFKQFIDGLLESLEMYPQDEADVFSVLYHIGQSHENFAVCIIKKVIQEIDPDSGCKLDFDSATVAAFLVLAISAVHSSKQNFTCIPPRIFSYSVAMLGRISRALSDVMNQNTLLTYLSQCASVSSMDLNWKEPFLQVCKQGIPNYTSTEVCTSVGRSLQQKDDEAFEIQSQSSQIWCKQPSGLATSHIESQLEERDEVRKSMNRIFGKIKAIWSLVQSGCRNEALRALRTCKAEVATFTTDSLESAGALAFTLQYLQVIKLLASVWEHFLPTRKLQSKEIGELEHLLGKLDRKLRKIRCRFVGLSKEEELNVLELVLVTCLLKLSKVEICCYLTTMKKLSSTISHVELLCKEGCIEPSNFFNEIKRALLETGTSFGSTSCGPFLFKKLVDCFSLEQLLLCGSPRHIKAELDVHDNNSENPIPFVPGLPAAIPFEITLCNISSEGRLWLRMTLNEESTQFVFLDLILREDCEEIKKSTFVAPFYKTPKTISFTLMVSVGMECLFEDVPLVKGCGGPKHALIYLCREKEVFLSVASKH